MNSIPYEYEIELEVKNLLKDSPLSCPQAIESVEDMIVGGEYNLAFDNLCSWIYEDNLPITHSYYERLRNASVYLGSQDLIEGIRTLISA